MPAFFAFPDSRVGVWMPEPLTRSAGFGIFTHTAIARIRDGATIAGARNDMDAIIAGLPQSFPGSTLALSLARDRDSMRSVAITLKDATVGQVERTLWILLGSVGVVLLVAAPMSPTSFLRDPKCGAARWRFGRRLAPGARRSSGFPG